MLSLVRFRRARSVIGLSADRTIGLGTITRNNIKANSHGGGARANVIINDSVSLRCHVIPDGDSRVLVARALTEKYLLFVNYNRIFK